MHPSVRAGAAPRRIVKRVYLPMRRGRVTMTSRIVPTRSLRSTLRKRRTLPRRASLVTARGLGQLRPRQRTVVLLPDGAATLRRVMRTVDRSTSPRIRTIGNGVTNSVGAGTRVDVADALRRTVTVWKAVDEAPALSVTRSVTTCVPAVVKAICARPPPASSNAPSPSRSQAWLAIEPSASPDLETKATLCPTAGDCGLKEKDASGDLLAAGAAGAAGGAAGAGAGPGAGAGGVAAGTAPVVTVRFFVTSLRSPWA